MARVSVLLPCYNAGETLSETIASLERQTLGDYEVVAVDDGSLDGTPALLSAWADRDRRVRVLPQAHAGLLASLNAGLAACRAPYIARLDADDRAHPRRLEEQAAYLDQHPETSLVSCRVAAFPAGQVRGGFQVYLDWLNGLLEDADIRREIFVESPLPHPSVTFRAEAVRAIGGYEEHSWPEDYDLWLRLYLAGAHFAKLPEVLQDWREHPNRLTRTDSRYSLENFLRCKAYYLCRGPLQERDGVLLWGAGMMGRRLGKHLLREGAPLAAFIDIDPRKIGRTRRGRPILAPEEALPGWWQRYRRPALIVAVGTRGVRPLIRSRLAIFRLVEGQDWWFAA